MTREQLIKRAMKLVAPPASEHADCQAQIERALEVVESAGRDAEHSKITKKARGAYSAALKRLLIETRAIAAAGGALAMLPSVIEGAVAFDNMWSAGWRPHSRWKKQEWAAALAHHLLAQWRPEEKIVATKGKKWHRLAAILYGDPDDDLYRQLLKYLQIRSRQNNHTRI
jgi:hypothetical protein